MVRKILILAAACVAAPAAADSGGLGANASATASFQVYIPPIAASLRAANSGARGIWTVKGRDGGLMIGLNRKGDGYDSITLFSRPSMGLEVSWGTADGDSLPAAKSDVGGLYRSIYALPEGFSPVRTFVVSAI